MQALHSRFCATLAWSVYKVENFPAQRTFPRRVKPTFSRRRKRAGRKAEREKVGRRRGRKTSRRHCCRRQCGWYGCMGEQVSLRTRTDAALNCEESEARSVVRMKTGVSSSERTERRTNRKGDEMRNSGKSVVATLSTTWPSFSSCSTLVSWSFEQISCNQRVKLDLPVARSRDGKRSSFSIFNLCILIVLRKKYYYQS